MEIAHVLPVVMLEPGRLQEVLLGLLKLPDDAASLDETQIASLAVIEWLNHLGLSASIQDKIYAALPKEVNGLQTIVITDSRYMSFQPATPAVYLDIIRGEPCAAPKKPKTHHVCVVRNVIEWLVERVTSASVL